MTARYYGLGTLLRCLQAAVGITGSSALLCCLQAAVGIPGPPGPPPQRPLSQAAWKTAVLSGDPAVWRGTASRSSPPRAGNRSPLHRGGRGGAGTVVHFAANGRASAPRRPARMTISRMLTHQNADMEAIICQILSE